MPNLFVNSLAAFCLTVAPAFAAPTFSVGEIPKLANKDGAGLLIDLIHHMETLDSASIDFSVAPLARSVANVKSGTSDVHMPMMDPGRGRTLANDALMFSSATLGTLEFGVFHPEGTTIDVNAMADLNFETLSATADLFDFSIGASNCLPCTLKKVKAGRLDGLITARFVGQQIVDATGTAGIAYTHFKNFPIRFVLRNGDAATDQWLSATVDDLRASGALQKTLPMYKQPN